MQYINNTTQFQLKHTAICLGKFDGIHIGHLELIKQTVSYKTKGYQAVTFSFALHPLTLFSQEEIQLLDTEEEKRKKLEEAGMDILISYPFTKETAAIEPETFIKDILVKQMGAKIIIVGDDFCFGHNRRGNVDLLEKLSYQCGYHLVTIQKVEIEGAAVSSTRIRELLQAGNIELVNRMIGRPFTLEGEVVEGKKLGRTIEIPTMNQIPEPEKLLPPNGVYISSILIDQKKYGGITNIGYKPTIDDEKKKVIETHVFDFDGDLYGKEVKISLYSYVRPEQRFASIALLKEQIVKDITYSKKYLFYRKILE